MRASVQWDTADPTIIAEPALFLLSPYARGITAWAHQHPS
jgi:hypothetical protein